MEILNRKEAMSFDAVVSGLENTAKNNVKYRSGVLLFSWTVSSLLILSFGASIKNLLGVSAWYGALEVSLIGGTGWVLQAIIMSLLIKDKFSDYLVQMSLVLLSGLIIFVPSIIVSFVLGHASMSFVLASAIVSLISMLALHIRAVKRMQISQAVSISWFFYLVAGAIFWAYNFYMV